jgi:LemA protein
VLIWLAGALVIVAVAVVVLLYNRLTRARNRTHAAWGDVDSELRRRADLVPELNAAVAEYADHERSLFEAAAEARAEAMGAGDEPAVRAVAERRLGSAIGGVVGIAEANPELRASERFAQLSQQLSQTENRIALARMVYNDTVQTYNSAIQAVPASLLAGPLGFRRRALFELADGRT